MKALMYDGSEREMSSLDQKELFTLINWLYRKAASLTVEGGDDSATNHFLGEHNYDDLVTEYFRRSLNV